MADFIQKADLKASSFNNLGTAASSGVTVNTGAGSDVAAAIGAAAAAAGSQYVAKSGDTMTGPLVTPKVVVRGVAVGELTYNGKAEADLPLSYGPGLTYGVNMAPTSGGLINSRAAAGSYETVQNGLDPQLTYQKFYHTAQFPGDPGGSAGMSIRHCNGGANSWGAWKYIGGTEVLASGPGFRAVRHADGTIVQTATLVLSGAALTQNADVVFPVVFPSGCISFVASCGVAVNDYDAAAGFRDRQAQVSYGYGSTSGVEGQLFNDIIGYGRVINWIATGY